MFNILLFKVMLLVNSLLYTCDVHKSSSYIPIIVQSNIEVYDNEGSDLFDNLKIRIGITNIFEDMEGVEVQGNDPSEHDGMFFLMFNITKLPNTELYTLNFFEAVNFTCDTINPTNELNVWKYQGNFQVIVDNPLVSIEQIALLFEQNRVKPMLDVINSLHN